MGRINVRTIPVTAAGNYLSKKFRRRERCLKSWRLRESVGDRVSTRFRDIVVNSAFTRIYYACKPDRDKRGLPVIGNGIAMSALRRATPFTWPPRLRRVAEIRFRIP